MFFITQRPALCLLASEIMTVVAASSCNEYKGKAAGEQVSHGEREFPELSEIGIPFLSFSYCYLKKTVTLYCCNADKAENSLPLS